MRIIPTFAREQRLKTLQTSRRLDDLDFAAGCPGNTESPLIGFIVDIAQAVSAFETAAV